jgi:hypothetical protein
MDELELSRTPDRATLRAAIRARWAGIEPTVRILAEDLQGLESRIDFIGVAPGGGAVVALIGRDEPDLSLVARGAAQRAWVAARLVDWLKLAPGLGVDPEAPVRLMLFAPAFGGEARAAARALQGLAGELCIYRALRRADTVSIIVEPFERPPLNVTRARFRTGLSDAQLGFSGLDAPRGDTARHR